MNIEDKLEETRQTIFELFMSGDYNKGLPLVYDALKKYPNDFNIIKFGADFLLNRAWSYDDENLRKKDSLEAIEFLEKAKMCTFADKKTEKYQKFWLTKDIAYLYYNNLGDYEMALKIIDEINESHAFNNFIAEIKYDMGDKKECKRLLQTQLTSSMLETGWVFKKLADCYEDEGNLEMALEAIKAHVSYTANFTWEIPNHADNICSSGWLIAAKYCKKLGRIDEMWEYIDKAVYHCVKFCKNPSYKHKDVKFMDESNDISGYINSFENMGYKLLKDLEDNFKEFEIDERYKKFYEELNNAKKTKIEAGVWENGNL